MRGTASLGLGTPAKAATRLNGMEEGRDRTGWRHREDDAWHGWRRLRGGCLGDDGRVRRV